MLTTRKNKKTKVNKNRRRITHGRRTNNEHK